MPTRARARGSMAAAAVAACAVAACATTGDGDGATDAAGPPRVPGAADGPTASGGAATLPGAATPGDPADTAPALPPIDGERLDVDWGIGLLLVETRVDGQGPWRFLLDTGASFLAVSPRVVEALHLPCETIDPAGGSVAVSDTAGGEGTVVRAARLRSLAVGATTRSDLGAVVLDLAAFERLSGRNLDGVLPAAWFAGHLLTLDFDARTATVSAGELPPADGRDVLATVEGASLPYVVIDVAGNPCPILLDTGSRSDLALPAAVESVATFRSGPAVTGLRTTIAGFTTTRGGRLAGSLLWGRHRLADPIVDLAAEGPGRVGTRFLARFRTTFDFGNGRVRFDRPGDAAIGFPSFRSCGAGFVREGDVWQTAYVISGGPAARAGLRPGDRVERVNGRAAGDLDPMARDVFGADDFVRFRVAGPEGGREIVVAILPLIP